MICPQCSRPIPGDDVNVDEGVAYCRACNSVSRLSEILAAERAGPAADPGSPPPGCGVHGDGVQTILHASARSAGGFLGALFVAGFWNGIVSVFVLLALGSTLRHMLGSTPSWFPSPMAGASGPSMPVGMTVFLWVFLTPFITIGLVMIGVVCLNAAGRLEVRIRGERGVVFLGCGPIGWTRRFDALSVRSVKLGETTWRENDRTKPVIVLTTDAATIRFGSTLTEARRSWLLAATRATVLAGGG